VTDVTHQGSGGEGSGIRVPHDAPDQPGGTQLAQERKLGHRRPRTLRRIVLTLTLLLAVVAGSVVWVSLDAVKARDELKAAATQVHLLQDQVQKGDRKAAAVTIKSLQAHAAAAQAKTHGPQWSVVGALPWLGPNVKAVQTISEVVNGLAVKALPSLMDATALADPATLASSDGGVDLKPLVRAAAKVVAANAELQSAARRLDAIDPKPLLAAVAAPLADLRAQVTKFALTTATAARAVQLLSSTLGG